MKYFRNKEVQAILVVLAWVIALFPGRLGFDGAEAIRMIQRDESTDWWGASFFWFLRIATLGGQTIAIAAVIQLFILFTSLRLYLYSLPTSRKVAQNAVLVITATPLFGFFGAGISHDVFLVSGILLILSEENCRIFRIQRNWARSSYLLYYFTLLIYLSMTKIGLLVFLFYCLLLALRKNFFKSVSMTTAGIVFYLVSSVGITPQASGYYLWPAFADLKCVAQHSGAEITTSQWNWLDDYASLELWKTPISCSSMDQAVESLGFQSDVIIPVNSEFFRNYLAILKQNPAIVVMAHINRSRVALPPPFFPVPNNQVNLNSEVPIGQGTNTALQSGPEVLHPSIDEPSMKVNKGPLILVEQVVQIPTFLINQASWFWGWGGMWLWIIGFYFLKKGRPVRIRQILMANWPTFLLHATLVFVAPTSLPRYVMSTIYCGLVASVVLSLEYIDNRKFRTLNETEL